MPGGIPTPKDADQVLRYSFDDATNSIRTNATFSGSISVDLDQADDSVAIGDGTTLYTGTTVGPDHGLDVNVIHSVLPDGASTSALQTTGNTSLSAINGKLNTLGQKTMANSMPVVIASDQSTIAVSLASSPLPTGAATSANQTTEIASLASIDAKLNSLGQKAMAASVPVVIASDQSAVAVSVSSSALPTGASTSALQTTGNTSLSSIDTKLTTVNIRAIDASTDNIMISDNTNNVSVTAEGRMNVSSITLFTKPYDAITVTYPTTVQEVYVTRTGGTGGAIQQTVTVNYTDATKNFITDVART